MEFLRDLKGRGVDSVKLAVADAHTGLMAEIARVLDGHLAALSRARDGKCAGARATGLAHRRCRSHGPIVPAAQKRQPS